jgi:hypothetical protein
MKAFIATYEDKNHNPNADNNPTLMIAAQSLKHAATKAHEEQNASGRGDLIRVELTDKVII